MIEDIMLYFRIVTYALAAMGMFISAVIEYQTGRSISRLVTMISVVVILIALMFLAIGAVGFPHILQPIRSWILTPAVAVLTVFIWAYVIKRTKVS